MSFIIPKVHNCHQKRTEPRLQETGNKNLVMISLVVFKLCERTDKQTFCLYASQYTRQCIRILVLFNIRTGM